MPTDASLRAWGSVGGTHLQQWLIQPRAEYHNAVHANGQTEGTLEEFDRVDQYARFGGNIAGFVRSRTFSENPGGDLVTFVRLFVIRTV